MEPWMGAPRQEILNQPPKFTESPAFYHYQLATWIEDNVLQLYYKVIPPWSC